MLVTLIGAVLLFLAIVALTRVFELLTSDRRVIGQTPSATEVSSATGSVLFAPDYGDDWRRPNRDAGGSDGGGWLSGSGDCSVGDDGGGAGDGGGCGGD